MCAEHQALSRLVEEKIAAFPCSGEINLTVENSTKILLELHREYAGGAESIDEIDGLGVNFNTWRFNVRSSNTEPLLRVNVETKADQQLLTEKTHELLTFIKSI